VNPITESATKAAAQMAGHAENDSSHANRPARRLRADAARNQQRILVAARELFASHGLDITLDLVAEHAGVGVGTVYRRFANKQELIAECFEDGVRRMTEQAGAALDNPDPWAGLVQFFDYACEDCAASRGLSEVVRSLDDFDNRVARIREQLEPAVTKVVERARAAGVLRPEVQAGDFAAMIHMLDAIAVFARPVNPTAWRRYFELMLDSMRADSQPRVPLTTPPLTPAEVGAAKRQMSCFDRRK
jgi:AcrR family transcriptional regulator